MDRVLWAQNERPTIAETIIIDGCITNIKDDLIRKDSFDLLMKVSENGKNIIKKSLTSNTSKSLACYVRNRRVFIKSNYIEKDDRGRLMAFMFVASIKAEGNVIHQLQIDSMQINRTVSDNDIKAIQTALSNRNKLKNIYLKVLVIILLITIILIWTK